MRIGELNSLSDLVRRGAARFGETTALASVRKTHGELTYGALDNHMGRAAGCLRGLGLKPGARVLLAIESGPEWAAALFGILEAGLVAVPIAADTDLRTVAAIRDHAQAAAIILSERTKRFTDARSAARVVHLNALFNASSWQTTTAGDPRSLAMLAFTSGSTGTPRAVELAHQNLLCNADAVLQTRGGDRNAALLSMLPPAHLFELVVGLLAPLACGARVVYCDGLLPNRIIDTLRERRITHALAVPALVGCLYDEVVSQLIEAGAMETPIAGQSLAVTAERLETEWTEADWRKLIRVVRSRIGESFQTLVVGGAAIDPELARFIRAVGIGVDVGYGLTEAGPVVTLGASAKCPPGSVGKPLPGVRVRISRSGEILVRGPSVMRRYFRDPQVTAAAFKDGWLRTGDRGTLDSRGNLYITGRTKEAIVTAAGETIFPAEIEAYYHHKLFAERCVAGLPSGDGNDRPTLFVVPVSPQISDDELRAAFSQLRAAAPRRLHIQNMIRLSGSLPRTASGKVRRAALKEQYK